MRLSLGHLDARALNFAFGAGDAMQQASVRSATSLRGVLRQEAGLFELSDVEAEWLALDTLELRFGSVQIRARAEATFGNVEFRLEQRSDTIELELKSQGAHAAALEIDAGTVHLVGDTRMQRMRLWVRDAEGMLEAEHARASEFRMRIGDLVLSAPELAADALMIGWGKEGFRLEAKRLLAPQMRLLLGTTVLDAEGVEIETLHVRGADVSFARASVVSAQLGARFEAALRQSQVPEPSAQKLAPPAAGQSGTRPVFDFRLLDGLSGALHVDAVVDMTVPILGRRRATHKLRLSVEEGSIDYRELEADLSALEESLLDFSVRDGALVLERGIPLLPTRGFGKRLLIWELSPADLLLAQKRRIKLSVLPSVRLAHDLAQAHLERDASSSSFSLQRLGLENIDLKLALDEVDTAMNSALRKLSFERLAAQGQLQHELKGESGPGVVHAQLDALNMHIEGLSLGELQLDVESLRLQSLRDAALSFHGLTPTELRVEIAGLVAKGAHLTPERAVARGT